jgi:hypothetical protein
VSSVAAISGEGSGDKAACLFRGGNAEDALFMKRVEGRPMLAGGNSDQVLAQIADLYVATRDPLVGSDRKRTITVSTSINEDAADIGLAIRTTKFAIIQFAVPPEQRIVWVGSIPQASRILPGGSGLLQLVPLAQRLLQGCGSVVAFWSGLSGMTGMMSALDMAYGHP